MSDEFELHGDLGRVGLQRRKCEYNKVGRGQGQDCIFRAIITQFSTLWVGWVSRKKQHGIMYLPVKTIRLIVYIIFGLRIQSVGGSR